MEPKHVDAKTQHITTQDLIGSVKIVAPPSPTLVQNHISQNNALQPDYLIIWENTREYKFLPKSIQIPVPNIIAKSNTIIYRMTVN